MSTWRPDEEYPVLLELRRFAERHVGDISDRRHSLGDVSPLESLLRHGGFRAFRCLVTLFVIVLPSSITAQKPGAGDRSSRPNVIVFFMDDLGYGDLRAYGATDVRTPNLGAPYASRPLVVR